MKRIVLSLIFASLTLAVGAQTSTDILRRVSAHVDSLGQYSVDFVMNSAQGQANGSYAVDGTKFRIDTGAIELLCDGKMVYEIDNTAREVAIDNMVVGDASIWVNPAKAFSMLDTRFNHELLGSETTNGKTLYRIHLTSREQGLDGFTLLVNAATLLPYKAIYGEGNQQVSILFVRIRGGEVEPSHFEFNKAAFADYEIIDLR